MKSPTSVITGCGHSACACMESPAQSAAASSASAASATPGPLASLNLAQVRVNGVAVQAPSEALSSETLRERVCTLLLRQEAARQGLLPPLRSTQWQEPGELEQAVLEAMVDQSVPVETPSDEACARYFEDHAAQFVQGQAVHLRHILFAVTPGVDVTALARRAEMALLELLRKDVQPGRFAELAHELSNCPTGAQGGDLGWIGPEDCVPELANELFFQKHAGWGLGVHPRLVHTRHGLHIIEVLAIKRGKKAQFEEVIARVRADLEHHAHLKALQDWLHQLADAAVMDNYDWREAATPLVQ